MTKTRVTPQTRLVLTIANNLGHATNAEILQHSRKVNKDISATTVHRITKRLVNSGALGSSVQADGSILIDANNSTHDHFVCIGCGGVKDFVISENLRYQLAQSAGIEIMPLRLTIYGDCKNCK